MDPRALAAALNALRANENASLARHLVEAKPYVNAQTFRLWRDVQKIEHDSIAHAQRLVKLIASLHEEVRPLPFQQSVADFHYMDLITLLPHLIAEKKAQISAYDHAAAGADAKSAVELAALRNECASHLVRLENSASKLGVPAA